MHDQQNERNDAVLRALATQSASSWPPPPGDGVWGAPSAPQPLDNPDAIEEGAGRTPLAVWVLVDGALGLVLAVVLQAIILFGFMAARGISDQAEVLKLQDDPTFTLLAAPTLGVGFATMAALRIRLLRKLSWAWFGLHARRLLPAIGWGVVAGVTFLMVNAVTGILLQSLGSEPDQAEQLTRPFKSASSLQVALLGAFIVLIGPFLEEVFFRGYAFRAIRQRLGVVWGLILSAALFAAPHAFGITTGYIGLLVPIFAGGLILAYVYQRTGSLWSAVTAHCINNLIGFLGLLYTLAN